MYGFCLKSEIPGLPGFPEPERGARKILLAERRFPNAPRPAEPAAWFHHASLGDGSTYLRWTGLFEFLISADGRRIDCHRLDGGSREALPAYLLGQALSFAMLKQGIEPIHASAVAIDGEAVCFIGDCGRGKSTLAASFLGAGYPLLTDDLLVVKEDRRGYYAWPGFPQIKLYPEPAGELLGDRVRGSPMNLLSRKLVIPLKPSQFSGAPVRLKAIYILARSRSGIAVKPLSRRRGLLELIKNTFNRVVVDRDRLERQFVLAFRLADAVPLKLLSYPKSLAGISSVRRAVLSDCSR